jgi:hypothetical protein
MTLPSGYWRRSCRPHTCRTPLRCTGPAPPPHTCKPSSITCTPPYQPDIKKELLEHWFSYGTRQQLHGDVVSTTTHDKTEVRARSVSLSNHHGLLTSFGTQVLRSKIIARHPNLPEPALRLNLHSGLSGLGCLVLRLARGEPRVSTCEGRRGTRPLHADRHAPRRGLARGGVRHA